MGTIKFLRFPLLLIILLTLITMPFQSCEPEDNDDDCDTHRREGFVVTEWEVIREKI